MKINYKKKQYDLTFKNIFYYFQGNIRYFLNRNKNIKILKLFSSELHIENHIEEQALYRQKKANKICVNQGFCKICHCKTPELFFADKPCEGNCYPAIMNKEEWSKFKKQNKI